MRAEPGRQDGMSGAEPAAVPAPVPVPAPLPVLLEPEFLDGFARGPRFALWVRPGAGVPARGAVLAIQPFGEEANLARRVLLAQSMRLAQDGWTVLIADLFGTGDSSGRTEDAELHAWRADLLRLSQVLRDRAPGRFVLWGLRMGTLLAVDIAIAQDQLVDALVLWQPVATGGALLDPLLKLARVGALARQAAGGTHAADAARDEAGKSPTAATAAGDAARTEGAGQAAGNGNAEQAALIDLAGSRLQRELVDELRALELAPPTIGEHGRPMRALMLGMQRIVPEDGAAPPALAKLARAWEDRGHLVDAAAVQAEPFWNSLEPSMPEAALEATVTYLRDLDGLR